MSSDHNNIVLEPGDYLVELSFSRACDKSVLAKALYAMGWQHVIFDDSSNSPAVGALPFGIKISTATAPAHVAMSSFRRGRYGQAAPAAAPPPPAPHPAAPTLPGSTRLSSARAHAAYAKSRGAASSIPTFPDTAQGDYDWYIYMTKGPGAPTSKPYLDAMATQFHNRVAARKAKEAAAGSPWANITKAPTAAIKQAAQTFTKQRHGLGKQKFTGAPAPDTSSSTADGTNLPEVPGSTPTDGSATPTDGSTATPTDGSASTPTDGSATTPATTPGAPTAASIAAAQQAAQLLAAQQAAQKAASQPPPPPPSPSTPSSPGGGGGGGGGGSMAPDTSAPEDGSQTEATAYAPAEETPPADDTAASAAPASLSPAAPQEPTPPSVESTLASLIPGQPAPTEALPNETDHIRQLRIQNLWRRWLEWGSPFATTPGGGVDEQAIANVQISGEEDNTTRIRFLGHLSHRIQLLSPPGMWWTFVKKIEGIDYNNDQIQQGIIPERSLHPGSFYEFKVYVREKGAPNRTAVQNKLREMGFSPMKLALLKKNIRLPNKPSSLAAWYGFGQWLYPHTLVTVIDPFFFEQVKEITP
jgi:hypothetical protein